jgi:probable dihydroxyacetone kinase regulator
MVLKPDTDRILGDSIESLLSSTSIDKITVQKIIENCDVNRSTFYRHFKDKYDLMTWVYKNKVDAFIEETHDLSRALELASRSLEYIHSRQNYFAHIVSYGAQNSFQEFFFEYTSKNTMMALRRSLGTFNLTEQEIFSIRLFVAGATYLVMDWIKSGCRQAPGELAKQILMSSPDMFRPYIVL